jgi:hypothetical protein
MAPPEIPKDVSASGKPQRRRRWIPLSLRMFAVLLALLTAASALSIGVPAWRQYRAIREVERLGGSVQTNPNGPKWMRDQLGDDTMRVFDQAIMVRLDGTRADDATLRQIACLTELRILNLGNTRVTDAGLEHLKELDNVRFMGLAETAVTNAGLAHLKRPNRLIVLDLTKTQVKSLPRALVKGLPDLKTVPGPANVR